jgi:Na+-driven multidrug efflux pump
LAYFLARYLNWGPTGVFVAIPVSETSITIASFILFKSGRWKTKKV